MSAQRTAAASQSFTTAHRFAAHVLDRLADQREQLLQLAGDGLHGHAASLVDLPGYPSRIWWITARPGVGPARGPCCSMAAPTAPLTLSARLAAWRYAFLTTNPPEQGVVDGVTPVAGGDPGRRAADDADVGADRGAAGGDRTLADVAVDWFSVTLAVVGIVLAHLANNLMNDLADTQVGNDTVDYPRTLRPAPDPVRAGDEEAAARRHRDLPGTRPRHHAGAHPASGLVDRGVRARRAVPVVGVHRATAAAEEVGLGELDVLITWGPLMVGGVYYAGTGTLPWQVVAAATVYALLPTTVLMGKHIGQAALRRTGRHRRRSNC